jgi:hypothetical protein
MATAEPLLDFQRAMLAEIISEDCLVVLGSGLGLYDVLLHFVLLHCHKDTLVLLINSSQARPHAPPGNSHARGVAGAQAQDTRLFEDALCHEVGILPRSLTNETPSEEREKVYNDGGVVSVTNRILTVDFLCKRVPLEAVKGIVVCNAHKVVDTSNEAFALRLYRQVCEPPPSFRIAAAVALALSGHGHLRSECVAGEQDRVHQGAIGQRRAAHRRLLQDRESDEVSLREDSLAVPPLPPRSEDMPRCADD